MKKVNKKKEIIRKRKIWNYLPVKKQARKYQRTKTRDSGTKWKVAENNGICLEVKLVAVLVEGKVVDGLKMSKEKKVSKSTPTWWAKTVTKISQFFAGFCYYHKVDNIRFRPLW